MIKKAVLIFVILSIIASGLNYFLYPVLSRVLGPLEYVDVTVALSLFTQISAFLSSIIAITIGLSKSADVSAANKKIEALQSFILRLFSIIALLFLAISPLVMPLVDTPILFAVPIALMMLFTIPIQIISGYLNGKNKLIKLGAITVFCALVQFTVGITVASLTHSGLFALLAMSVSQLLSIALIYKLLPADGIPNVVTSLKTPLSSLKTLNMKKILIYTGIASLAIMAINVVQVADLLVLQSLEGSGAKFYADIYVISRAVFFAGTIFIWPFLGEIDIANLKKNRRPFVKVISYFTAIAIATIIALVFFGDTIAQLLFNAQYTLETVSMIGVLSVIYKLLLLIIMASVLYFVVLRSYTGVVLAALVTISIFVVTQILGKNPDMSTALWWLNGTAAVYAIVSIVLVFFYRTKQEKTSI